MQPEMMTMPHPAQDADQEKKEEILRLFYALWPDASTRKILARWQNSLRGRKVPPHNLHITLAFLGNQPASLLPTLYSIMDGIAFPTINLKLDRLGYFANNRIAWAGMNQTPSELADMHAALNSELKSRQIRHDERKKYTPHITLARDAARPYGINPEPIFWHADNFALVHSPMNGEPYRLLASKRPTKM